MKYMVDLRSGFLSAMIAFLTASAYASILFTGEQLQMHLPRVTGALLISFIVMRLITVKLSRVAGAVAGPQNAVIILIALMASAISVTLSEQGRTDQIYPTVIALIFLATGLIGISFILLGYFHLGRLIRYIPYPVIGGVLAGIGWVLILRGLFIITNEAITWTNLPLLLQTPNLLQIIVGLSFALMLTYITKKRVSPLPLTLLLAGFGVLFLTSYFIFNEPSSHYWFLTGITSGNLWPPYIGAEEFALIDWKIIFEMMPNVGAMILSLVISFLINSTSLEYYTKRDMSIDRELEVSGISNIGAMLCGGIGGCLLPSATILNLKLGGSSIASAIFSSALLGALVLFLDSSYLNFLPKALLGGITLFFGINYLEEWVYRTRFNVTTVDYVLILLILAIIAFFGILPGVIAGIAIAAVIFIIRYSQTNVIKYVLTGSSYQSNVDRSISQQEILQEQGTKISIIKLQGFIFFGTAYSLLEKIKQRVEDPSQPQINYLILDFSRVNNLDSSAVQSFVKLMRIAAERSFVIIFSDLTPQIRQQIELGAHEQKEGESYAFFKNLDYSVEWCEDRLLEKVAPISVSYVLPQIFKEFLPYFEKIRYETGDYLIHQGDPSNELYFILSGKVTVLLELPDKRKERLRAINAGTFIGELGFYLDVPRTTSVVAEEPTALYVITKNKLDKLKIDNPQLVFSFYENVARMLAGRVVNDNRTIQTLIQ
jgi:sulfate permease, SulP family